MLTFFGKQWNFKYIPFHRYWTNEYPNIFVSINRWWMNIRIYSPWKKLTNIWTNEYICLNIFKYIRIFKYLSHTAWNWTKKVFSLYITLSSCLLIPDITAWLANLSTKGSSGGMVVLISQLIEDVKEYFSFI